MRLDEERSDELALGSLATNTARACTSLLDDSSVIIAIIIIPKPNPFRDSLRSSQREVRQGEEGSMTIIPVSPHIILRGSAYNTAGQAADAAISHATRRGG